MGLNATTICRSPRISLQEKKTGFINDLQLIEVSGCLITIRVSFEMTTFTVNRRQTGNLPSVR